MTDQGWFADQGDTDEDDFMPEAPWRVYLQGEGTCIPMRVWFQTKADAERFIRDEIVGMPWLDRDR